MLTNIHNYNQYNYFRINFINNLIDDRSESSFSYYEFLQHLKTQIK